MNAILWPVGTAQAIFATFPPPCSGFVPYSFTPGNIKWQFHGVHVVVTSRSLCICQPHPYQPFRQLSLSTRRQSRRRHNLAHHCRR